MTDPNPKASKAPAAPATTEMQSQGACQQTSAEQNCQELRALEQKCEERRREESKAEEARKAGEEKAEKQRTTEQERLEKTALAFFEHVEKQIGLAVTKGSLLLAAVALGLGVYTRYATDHKIFPLEAFPPLGTLIFLLAGAVLLMSLLAALVAIWPRTISHGGGPLFFAWVAADTGRFRREFARLKTHEALYEELLARVEGKSIWLQKMYRWTQVSIVCLLVGSIVTSTAIVFLKSGQIKPAAPPVSIELMLGDFGYSKTGQLDCGAKGEYLIGEFDSGSVQIGGKPIDGQVDRIFENLKARSGGRSLQGIVIVGSADKRTPQSFAGSNDELAERRAGLVKDSLMQKFRGDASNWMRASPEPIVLLNPDLPNVRLLADGKSFDTTRSVQVCVVWRKRSD